MKNKGLLTIALLLFLSIIAVWYYSHKSAPAVAQDDTTLIVGTNAEFPPFTFIKNGEIVGFDIDVIKEVAHLLDKKIVFKDMSFDSLIIEALGGHIQVIAAGMTCTPEREKKIFFTAPYISGDPLVIVTLANQPKVNSLADLTGKEVIVNEGFTADTYMSTIKGPVLIRLATSTEALMALKAGQAHAFVSALNALKPLFDVYGKEAFSITPIEGTNENCSLGVSKQFPELFAAIDQTIQEMVKDGTIKNLKEKWGIA